MLIVLAEERKIDVSSTKSAQKPLQNINKPFFPFMVLKDKSTKAKEFLRSLDFFVMGFLLQPSTIIFFSHQHFHWHDRLSRESTQSNPYGRRNILKSVKYNDNDGNDDRHQLCDINSVIKSVWMQTNRNQQNTHRTSMNLMFSRQHKIWLYSCFGIYTLPFMYLALMYLALSLSLPLLTCRK